MINELKEIREVLEGYAGNYCINKEPNAKVHCKYSELTALQAITTLDSLIARLEGKELKIKLKDFIFNKMVNCVEPDWVGECEKKALIAAQEVLNVIKGDMRK